MNTKDFAVMMDDVVSQVIAQAYTNHEMTSLNCERTQRAFKYVIGNGFFRLGVECYGGQIGCWWTAALSIKPHELILGSAKDLCYEKAFCCQVREFLWACIHKMNDFASKRRLAGFVWPAIKPIEEYVEAGPAAMHGNDEVFDEPVEEQSVCEEEYSPEAEAAYQRDELTLDDEIREGLEHADVEQADDVTEDIEDDAEEPSVHEKRGLFGKKRKHKEEEHDAIAEMGDDHVNPELAAEYFSEKHDPIAEAESLDDLGDI